MNNNNTYLGIVHLGQFRILIPEHAAGASVRLTTIAMQAAQSPESGELDLSGYEGQAILVSGHNGGGWIYSAAVIDQAGPILTAVVQRVFGVQPAASN